MLKGTIFIISAVVMMVATADMAQRSRPPATAPIDEKSQAAFQESVRQHQQEAQAQARQKQVKKLQADLGSADEEFAVIQPLIEKCLSARDVATDFSSYRYFGVGRSLVTGPARPDGSPPADPPPGKTPAWIALQDLDQMLHDPNTTDAQIKAQMQIVRQDRQQAADDYAAACKQLRALITSRQEVVLFLNDVLD